MLMVNHLTGFGVAGGASTGGVAEDIVTGLSGSSVFGANTTFRLVVAANYFTVPFTSLKMDFKSGGGAAVDITAAYIGQAASSGNPYDFAATPTQILFAGSGAKTIASGATATTDVIAFAPDITRPIVISYDVNGSSDPGGSSDADFAFYQLGAAPKASELTPSGGGSNGSLRLVSRFTTYV